MRMIDGDALIHKIGEIPLEYENRAAVSLFYKMIETMPTLTPLNEWVDVNDHLPDPEEEVEVFCQTRWGTYTCHGFYVPDNYSEEDSDYCWDFECMDSYDEENNCYYIAPGWYERIHNWDDYGAVGINDKVTHWRPLSFPDFSKED